MPLYRKLNREEGNAIKRALAKHKLTLGDVAKKMGIHQSYISHMIAGQRVFRAHHADVVYQMLKKDKSVEFLGDYKENYREIEAGFMGDTEAGWLSLYYSYSKKLADVLKEHPKTRHSIIGELERLVDKYDTKKN